MHSANIPLNEQKRLEVLNNFKILDTLPEDKYDNITKIVSEICNTPIALISLVDSARQWFKSTYGINAKETSREYAFCAHSILEPDDLFIVPDATQDLRFKNNPLTTNSPNVIFYAGAPLITKEGYALGTLCVIDNKPRESLSDLQKLSLKVLAQQVVTLLELRKTNIDLLNKNKEVIRLNKELNQFAYKLSHDLKTPISGINALVEFIKEDLGELQNDSKVKEWISLIDTRTNYIESLIDSQLNYTKVTNEKIHFEHLNLKNLLYNTLKKYNIKDDVIINLNDLDINIFHSKSSLLEIFKNLLINSIQFCDKKKCMIEIDFIDSKDFYQFIYTDNGPGIDLIYKDKIFLMYETLDDANCKNTGFGLAIVKTLIDRLGGWISLNEKVSDKGVCFEFTLLKSNNKMTPP